MTHSTCGEAYLLNTSNADIKSLLSGKQLASEREQVRQKRQVLERVVDTVKVIGKGGLSYRSVNDAACKLEDLNKDHGNFLEISHLLSK